MLRGVQQRFQPPDDGITTLETVTVTAPRQAVGTPTRAPTPNSSAQQAEEDAPAPERTQPAPSRTSSFQPLPPNFAPSLQQGRDIRDREHPGHDAYNAMRQRVGVFETQHGIPRGEHSDRFAASLLQLAVDNKVPYSKVFLEKDRDTGQVRMLDRSDPFISPSESRQFALDPAAMSSQRIETSSQRLNEAVSRHYAEPPHTQVQVRTNEQSQALAGLSFEDKVMFGRIRGEIPGHVSDEHVLKAMATAKAGGVPDAASIGTAMMFGDNIRVSGRGEASTAVMVDVTQPAPRLDASIDAVKTLNAQQLLVQQQIAFTQNEPSHGSRTI